MPPILPGGPDEGTLVAMQPPLVPPASGPGEGPGQTPIVPPSGTEGAPGVVPPFIPPQPEAGSPPINNPTPYYPPNPNGGNYGPVGYRIPPLVPPTPEPGNDWYPYPGYEGYPETAHNFVGWPNDQYRGPRIVPVVMPRRTRRGTEIYAHRYDPPRIHKQHANGVSTDYVHRISGGED